MGVFNQLGQGNTVKWGMVAGLPYANEEEEAVVRARVQREVLGIFHKRLSGESVVDWLAATRDDLGAVSPGVGQRLTEPKTRCVYALGCWVAVERLTDRLERGNQVLQSLEEKGEIESRAYRRASITWLRLASRTVGLIARMGEADQGIAHEFMSSPTCAVFDGMAWPTVPDGVDPGSFDLTPARVVMGRMG